MGRNKLNKGKDIERERIVAWIDKDLGYKFRVMCEEQGYTISGRIRFLIKNDLEGNI